MALREIMIRCTDARTVARLAVAVVLITSGARTVVAQCSLPDTTPAAKDSSGVAHAAPWVTRNEAIAFGAATAGTVALAPFDKAISGEFVEQGWKRRHGLRKVANGVAFFGGDGPFVASAVILAASEAGGCPRLRRFAAHNMEAIALATIVTGIGKGISGRALPGVKTRHSFQFGRGFHDANGPFVSFPSGHTAAAFAMATTIAAEMGGADSAHARLVDYLAFGGATAVGVARVAQRMHWPSDLPMATFIGMWSGRVVQRRAADRGPIGAILRGMTVGMGPNARTEVGWSSLAGANGAR